MHRLLSAGDVVALKRFPVHIMPFNGADGARPCHIAGNPILFPLRVAGLVSLGGQGLGLVCRYLVVGHQDTAAVAAVLGIQQVDRMERGAGAREEVHDEGVGLVGNEEAEGILNGIQGFRIVNRLPIMALSTFVP